MGTWRDLLFQSLPTGLYPSSSLPSVISVTYFVNEWLRHCSRYWSSWTCMRHASSSLSFSKVGLVTILPQMLTIPRIPPLKDDTGVYIIEDAHVWLQQYFRTSSFMCQRMKTALVALSASNQILIDVLSHSTHNAASLNLSKVFLKTMEICRGCAQAVGPFRRENYEIMGPIKISKSQLQTT